MDLVNWTVLSTNMSLVDEKMNLLSTKRVNEKRDRVDEFKKI